MMVHYLASPTGKDHLRAFLIADLTPTQLDALQEAFRRGACSLSPEPTHELYIEQKKHWATFSHAEMRHALSDQQPFLVIDDYSPVDEGVWYIDRFAQQHEVDSGEVENTNVLWKIRMKIDDVVLSHVNYNDANITIGEHLASVNVPFPVPENFTQNTLFSTGVDYMQAEFIAPTWIVATPDEMKKTIDDEMLSRVRPKPGSMCRLKPDVARQHGFKNQWVVADEVRGPFSGNTIVTFPKGSLVLQMNYDPSLVKRNYQRLEGSL